MTRRSALRLIAAIAGIAMLATPHAATALTVSPVQVEITSVGKTGRGQFTVTNESQAPIPIEITVQKMTLGETGERTYSKAPDNLLILPAQVLIAPGASQVFRLQWVGDPMLQESHSFMVNVNQIPVKLQGNTSAVQVVMSLGVNVNVAPPQGAPSLRIVSTGVTTDAKTGKRHPTVTVENPTKIHALLPQSTIRFSSGAWSHTANGDWIGDRVGIGLVQPGRKRRFTLPVDLPANIQTVQSTIDFKPKR